MAYLRRSADASTNDARLFNGVFDQFDGGAATVKVTSIPFAHYDVYFYRADDGGSRAGSFTVGTATPGSDGAGYIRSTCATPRKGSDIDAGNYVEFENQSGPTLTATFATLAAGDGVQRTKVVGFQIVERK